MVILEPMGLRRRTVSSRESLATKQDVAKHFAGVFLFNIVWEASSLPCLQVRGRGCMVGEAKISRA